LATRLEERQQSAAASPPHGQPNLAGPDALPSLSAAKVGGRRHSGMGMALAL